MSYPTMSPAVPWSLVKSGFKKGPQFNGMTQKPAAGRGRSSLSFTPYATWNFELDLNAVSGGEAVAGNVLQACLGCFMVACGTGSFFYFTDPNDNLVSQVEGCLLNVSPGAALPMGLVGDGVSQQFQFARTVEQGFDVLQNVTGWGVYVSGVQEPVSISPGRRGHLRYRPGYRGHALLGWSLPLSVPIHGRHT